MNKCMNKIRMCRKGFISRLNSPRVVFIALLTFVSSNLQATEFEKAATLINAQMQLPDTTLVNQRGENVDFYIDIVKDKVVVINFVFTQCKMVCPLLGYNFGRLQKLLGDKAGKEVFLISISVDPVADTPEKLQEWASQFVDKELVDEELSNNENTWTLLTGEKTQVDGVLKALESFSADKVDHTSLVLMGSDSRVEWKRIDGKAYDELILDVLKVWF